jgi:predicted homoserine dehydrogenase-like protein
MSNFVELFYGWRISTDMVIKDKELIRQNSTSIEISYIAIPSAISHVILMTVVGKCLVLIMNIELEIKAGMYLNERAEREVQK